MTNVFFDLGGTLIDDPFPNAIEILEHQYIQGDVATPLPKWVVREFFALWKAENWTTHFSFASHFLQEETFPMRAAVRLTEAHGNPLVHELALFVPLLLSQYRQIAKNEIASQSHLPVLRETLKALREDGCVLVVGSNDREFATLTMLEWANIRPYFHNVFTSEGLSRKYPNAEKPSKEFLLAMLCELGQTPVAAERSIYVGDSETNDIVPAQELHFTTVRYLNKRNPSQAVWVQTSEKTAAQYHYEDFTLLLPTIHTVLSSVGH